MRKALTALAAMLALAGCGSPAITPNGLPKATLPGSAGSAAVDLGALKGPAVVNVWASYCTPCRTELPIYQRFAQAHRGTVEVLGIDYEDMRRDKALALLRSAKVTYRNVLDDDGVTRTRFLPRLLLIDTAGHVVHDEAVQIKSLAQLEVLVRKYLGVAR